MKSFASFLVSVGFQPGDVLQMGCSNHVLFYIPVMAAWMIGGTLIFNLMNYFTLTLLFLVHQLQVVTYLEASMGTFFVFLGKVLVPSKMVMNLPMISKKLKCKYKQTEESHKDFLLFLYKD